MQHRVVIPDYHPTLLNKLRGHWAKAARLKAADRNVIGLYCRKAGVPPATGRRRVRLHLLLGKGQRGGDPDAYFKSLLDALVACGMLIDDSRQHVELMMPTYERGPLKGTIIILEDMHRDQPAAAKAPEAPRAAGRPEHADGAAACPDAAG